MKKATIKALELIFAAEIESRLPFQSRRKIYPQLEGEGLVEKASITLPGRFPVTVEGYVLTHAGRIAYCQSCADFEE